MNRELLIVSENYCWHEGKREFVKVTDNTRYPDTSSQAKVWVFEDRMSHWFLDVAYGMVEKGQNAADYVATSVGLGYVEAIEQYRSGTDTPKGKAGEWFSKSAGRIFPNASEIAVRRLWKEARCGLFHGGFTIGPTYLSHAHPEPVAIDGEKLFLNPRRFLESLKADLKTYVIDVLAHLDDQLGMNFVRLWDKRWESS